jgi:hypothetical protein
MPTTSGVAIRIKAISPRYRLYPDKRLRDRVAEAKTGGVLSAPNDPGSG